MNPDERAAAVRRLTFLVAAVLIWAAAVFYKLISVQVLHHRQYVAIARKQQEHSIKVEAPRGSIYDRNGRPLAISVPVDSVFVNPIRLNDISIAAEMLAPILKLDQKKLEKSFKDAVDDHTGFLWVKRKISAEESRRLHDLKCDWIEFQTESVREYPDGGVASHILGGVYQEEKGFAGVEASYNKELKGAAGMENVVADVKHRIVESQIDKQAQPGRPVVLTVDSRIQFIAEREIAAAVEKHHCRSGTVIVMNPNTGEIYALANYPSYNPGEPPNPVGPEKNRLWNLGVQVPFEPGSIFKVITLSAALETTNLRPDSPINCLNGVIKLPGRVVHEAHGGYGMLTMAQVLEKSSNIGAIQIGSRVGRENMYEYIRRFGFGSRTGVPLPFEARGMLRVLDHWGTTSLASVSMGQEVSATSIQLARACSVIANGGSLVQPRLILKHGDVVDPVTPPKRIIRAETANTMRGIMEGVVLRGTARNTVKVPGYTVAGKTGTAQIYDVATRHYTHTYNASFMGFTPIQNPALVIVVTLNGTSGSAGYGGSAAGPVFNVVASEALRVLDIPKDRQEEPSKEELKLAEKQKKDRDAEDDLAIAGLGEGPNILEDDSVTVAKGPPVVFEDQNGPVAGPRVPNFNGKTMREVLGLAAQSGIPVVLDGSGIVRGQMPLAGEVLLPGQKVRVQFAR